MLASCSDYFRKMFEFGWKENSAENSNRTVDIQLENSVEVFEAMLKHMYTGNNDDVIITSSNVLELYEAADKYAYMQLQHHCLSYVTSIVTFATEGDMREEDDSSDESGDEGGDVHASVREPVRMSDVFKLCRQAEQFQLVDIESE